MNTHLLLATPIIALVLAGSACESSSRTSASDASVSRVDFKLEPSTHDLFVGETVTVFARSYDTYGRDPQLAWTTTAGHLTTEQNGRVARVMIDKPGTCIITAVLTADGREIKRVSVEVHVKPLS